MTPTGGKADRRGFLRLTGSQSGHISKFVKKAGGQLLRTILSVNLRAVRIGAFVSVRTHTAHIHHTTHTYSIHMQHSQHTHVQHAQRLFLDLTSVLGACTKYEVMSLVDTFLIKNF